MKRRISIILLMCVILSFSACSPVPEIEQPEAPLIDGYKQYQIMAESKNNIKYECIFQLPEGYESDYFFDPYAPWQEGLEFTSGKRSWRCSAHRHAPQ